MNIEIDGYSGQYRGIDYQWIKHGDYALFKFVVDGYNVEKKIGNVTGKPLEEDLIKLISDMEIDHLLTRVQNEKLMSAFIEGTKA